MNIPLPDVVEPLKVGHEKEEKLGCCSYATPLMGERMKGRERVYLLPGGVEPQKEVKKKHGKTWGTEATSQPPK